MSEPKLSPLFTEAEIAERIQVLAQEIASRQQDLLLISILKGSVVFTADLMRALSRINCTTSLDFLTLSSYQNGTNSSGTIRVVHDLTSEITGKHILLIDDIIDTGTTLLFAKNRLLGQGAKTVQCCALLNKPARRTAQIEADYFGFTIPDRFVVGYGLDYAGAYRDLPYIAHITF